MISMAFPCLSPKNASVLPRTKEENNVVQELILDTIKLCNKSQSAHECDRDYSIKLKVRLIYLEFSEKLNWRDLG